MPIELRALLWATERGAAVGDTLNGANGSYVFWAFLSEGGLRIKFMTRPAPEEIGRCVHNLTAFVGGRGFVCSVLIVQQTAVLRFQGSAIIHKRQSFSPQPSTFPRADDLVKG